MGSVCGAVWLGPLRVAEVYVCIALEHLDSLCELHFPCIHCTYELRSLHVKVIAAHEHENFLNTRISNIVSSPSNSLKGTNA